MFAWSYILKLNDQIGIIRALYVSEILLLSELIFCSIQKIPNLLKLFFW